MQKLQSLNDAQFHVEEITGETINITITKELYNKIMHSMSLSHLGMCENVIRKAINLLNNEQMHLNNMREGWDELKERLEDAIKDDNKKGIKEIRKQMRDLNAEIVNLEMKV